MNIKSNSRNFSLDNEKSPEPVILNAEAGLAQEMFTNPVLDIGKFVINELSFNDFTIFPVVLWLKNKKKSLFLYFKIKGKLLVKVKSPILLERKTLIF